MLTWISRPKKVIINYVKIPNPKRFFLTPSSFLTLSSTKRNSQWVHFLCDSEPEVARQNPIDETPSDVFLRTPPPLGFTLFQKPRGLGDDSR